MDHETEVLLHFLDQQREHVLGILEGLSEEQLRRPVLPSAWSCLGMVRQLALADEHYWFRSIVGGEPLGFFPQGPNAEWQVAPGEPAGDVFSLYRDGPRFRCAGGSRPPVLRSRRRLGWCWPSHTGHQICAASSSAVLPP